MTVLSGGLQLDQIGLSTICIAFWILLVIIFIIAEIISLGLTSIWFAIGAMVAAISAMLGAPIWLQVLLFIVVTAISLACTRKLAAKHLNNQLEKTNVEELIGSTSIVVEPIDNKNSTGKIRIRDIEWTARAYQEESMIPEGTKVVVREIQGVTCYVEPVEEKQNKADSE